MTSAPTTRTPASERGPHAQRPSTSSGQSRHAPRPAWAGITTAFSYLDVDVFLLDDHSFRVPPVVTDTATMLGNAAQIDWLIRALKYNDATFKLVALGGQFLNSAAVYETFHVPARAPAHHRPDRTRRACATSSIHHG